MSVASSEIARNVRRFFFDGNSQVHFLQEIFVQPEALPNDSTEQNVSDDLRYLAIITLGIVCSFRLIFAYFMTQSGPRNKI